VGIYFTQPTTRCRCQTSIAIKDYFFAFDGIAHSHASLGFFDAAILSLEIMWSQVLVINNYPDKRSFIRIKSNILGSKGTVVKNMIVYAGNPISDKELLSLSMEEIDNRLRDKLGKNKINTNILPNSSVPFMIVFSNLPKDVSEFEVEAISSSPAGK